MKAISFAAFLCATLVSSALAQSSTPGVTVVAGLAPDESLGRVIRVPYSTFVDRLVLQRALRTAKTKAEELGIERILVLGPTGPVPRRTPLPHRRLPEPKSGVYEGELLVYEVVKKA